MSFDEDLKRAQQSLYTKLNNARITAFVNFAEEVIITSPVDTGWFRENWQSTINTPAQDIIGEKSQGSHSVEKPYNKVKSSRLTDDLFLTNNLPYAQRLEEGWSSQAPAGWVRTASMSMERFLDDALKKAES